MTPSRSTPLLLSTILLAVPAAASDPAWVDLLDGRSLDGWEANEGTSSFRVDDGALIARGPRSHLFYVGPVEDAQFGNFELEAEVWTRPGANSGIFFHTRFQDSGWLDHGYEVQICNTCTGSGSYREHKKTGSLYGVRNVYVPFVPDETWFRMTVRVQGPRVEIRVGDHLVVDYLEPPKPERGRRAHRVLSEGTFALQCHDPQSEVRFRKLRVRALPDETEPPSGAALEAARRAEATVPLHAGNFPLIDFHVHLKGGLTLQEALEHSREVGINYGVAANCGVGFPITDDASLLEYLRSLEGQPVFKGMQAEGREWVTLFSPEAIARFDYVFTDSMTFTDSKGRRTRLWIPDEVHVEDAEEFMDLLVSRTVQILEEEPIDIYVNPTYLPAVIANRYDALWTPERMDAVIRAAVSNGVAIEINSRFRLPSPTFLRRAQAAEATFSLGTNNGDRELGRLEYALQMVKELGLGPDDLFLPKPDGKKPVQVKGLPKRS